MALPKHLSHRFHSQFGIYIPGPVSVLHMSSHMTRRALLASGGAAAAAALPLIAPGHAAASTPATQSTKASEFVPDVGPGNKFDFDGEALRYPGNSTVFHVPQDSRFHQALLQVRQEIVHSPVGKQHCLLPKNSLHMTCLNGTNENPAQRKYGYWPRDMRLGQTIEEVHQHFLDKLQGFSTDLPQPLLMRPTELAGPFEKQGLSLTMVPADEATAAALKSVRERLSALLQIRRPDFDTFEFHISLGYPWRRYSEGLATYAESRRLEWSAHIRDQAPQVELGRLEFVVFNDMLAYSPLMYLNS